MKNLILLVLLSVFIFSCKPGQKNGASKEPKLPAAKKYFSDDLEEYDLTGKVKSVSLRVYSVRFSSDSVFKNINGPEEPIQIILFHENGNIRQKLEYIQGTEDFPGIIFVQENYSYNENNQLIRVDVYGVPTLSEEDYQKGLTVDYAKKPIEEQEPFKSMTSKLYYENGHLHTDSLFRFQDDSVALISVNQYKFEGELFLKQTTFIGNDTLPFEIVDLSYDKKGFIKEQKEWNADDQYVVTTKYKLFPNGVREGSQRCTGEKCRVEAYEYDKRGNLISIKRADKQGKFRVFVEFSYSYDQNGNWRTKTMVKGGLPYREEREIEYY